MNAEQLALKAIVEAGAALAANRGTHRVLLHKEDGCYLVRWHPTTTEEPVKDLICTRFFEDAYDEWVLSAEEMVGEIPD